MDEVHYDDRPIAPMLCPRCGKKIIFHPNDEIECPSCGFLYYDQWLGIWRIKRTEVEED